MTVYRLTPLPTGANRGRLIVPASVLSATKAALQQFGGADGRHEGLVYWMGRRCEQDALAMTAVVPVSDHGLQHVFIAEEDVGRMTRQSHLIFRQYCKPLERIKGLALIPSWSTKSHGGFFNVGASRCRIHAV